MLQPFPMRHTTTSMLQSLLECLTSTLMPPLAPDYGMIGRIREVADEEEALSAPRKALLVNALPAIPVLLVGFICLEGNELVSAAT